MTTEYRAVDKEKKTKYWTPFLKQLHVSSGVWTLYFMNGLNAGAPTVFVPQIKKEWNSTVTIDEELASWIYSASNFAALPWLLFLPAISQLIGRKIPYLVCSILLSIVFTLLYFSTTPYHILIAETVQGLANAIGITIMVHIIPEYCNHRYRNMYLNIQVTTFYWGMWAANAIGTYYSWKYIPILGLICCVYSLSVCLYPESPRWLANRRKIKKCEAAFRWLHGTSPESEKELRELLKSQLDHNENNDKSNSFTKTLTSKQFYLPLLLAITIGAQYNLSGKYVCSIYTIEIFKKISDNENAAYTSMLVLDGVTVLGMYTGSFMSKVIRLRFLYFSLSFLGIAVMFTFSFYLYLGKLGIINESDKIALVFLVIYSLAISSGPIILCLNFYSEIISIRYQAISYAIASFVFMLSCTGMLRFSLLIFKELGLHGAFLLFGIGCGLTTVLLYIYLPETKGKTLEEIEQYFKDTEKTPEDETLNKNDDESNFN